MEITCSPCMIAQIVIAKHDGLAGLPLIQHTCRTNGSTNPPYKLMVFVPGLAQIHLPCEITKRAVDFGWTWGLIPLPFHGQSSQECSDAVFTDPSALAPEQQLGTTPGIYRDEVFRMHEAPQDVQMSGHHTCNIGLLDLA